MTQAIANVLFNFYCIVVGFIIGKMCADTESFTRGYAKAAEEIKAIYIKSIEDLANDRNMWLQVYLDIKKRYDIIVESFKVKEGEKKDL